MDSLKTRLKIQNTPPAISTAMNVIEIPLTSPSLYISQYCGSNAPASSTAERIPNRRTGAFVPFAWPAYRDECVSVAHKWKEERRTRRAKVIPASKAPKNAQKARKKRMQSLRGFLWP